MIGAVYSETSFHSFEDDNESEAFFHVSVLIADEREALCSN